MFQDRKCKKALGPLCTRDFQNSRSFGNARRPQILVQSLYSSSRGTGAMFLAPLRWYLSHGWIPSTRDPSRRAQGRPIMCPHTFVSLWQEPTWEYPRLRLCRIIYTGENWVKGSGWIHQPYFKANNGFGRSKQISGIVDRGFCLFAKIQARFEVSYNFWRARKPLFLCAPINWRKSWKIIQIVRTCLGLPLLIALAG